MAAGLIIVSVVIITYWILWTVHRSLVASSTSRSYVIFENAFPVADFFLVLCLVLAAWSLIARRRAALMWLLLGAGGGLYLLCMDVLYDLQHSVWGQGGNGLVELGINLATAGVSIAVLRWTWRRRDALLADH